MMTDYSKENYVTRNPAPSDWRGHANAYILREYGRYLHGRGADLGCNHGSCTMLFHEASDRVEHVTGVDMNDSALVVANRTRNSLGLTEKYAFVRSDLRELHQHFEPQSLDFVVSFHTLEHIYETDLHIVIEQVRRVLKPGSAFLVGTPYDHAYPDPCHVSFFKEADMQALMEAHGFETVLCMKDERWPEKGLLTALFVKSATPSYSACAS